jgi:alpha-amylase/alpha-mannosidase (GH57 family)
VFSVVIHGHFYQPPREDPFLDEVEAEPSAAPFHDWNQRIERECYRAVVAARVTGSDGRILRLVNTLESISFNFGPTLLEWMEREARPTYELILAADQESSKRLGGHGNAMAQPYHHTILPLATRRDKRTEVRWGIADFRRRFGREPEGMWLPETAVDLETLEVLAEEGIRFTIVAPHQVNSAPGGGRPGLCRLPGGKSIAVFVYRGDSSHAVAFGGALHDGVAWGRALADAAESPDAPIATGAAGSTEPRKRARRSTPSGSAVPARETLVAIATDGETYGHHHKFGEMALARALDELGVRGIRLENFGSFLARNPPVDEVELEAPTSWSCAHGVGRWKENCGCRIDAQRYPSQAWRTPLRAGLERLAASLHEVYEREAIRLIPDPWEARDAYGTVVASDAVALERFTRSVATGAQTSDDLVRARELLELERDALRMFTSCGWFFDDIAGIEPRQDLRYAARAIALAGREGIAAESTFLETLADAASNDHTAGTGRDIYLRSARPTFPAPMRHAAAAVAARHVAPGDRRRFTSATVEIDDDWVRVIDRRTGRRHDFRWRVTAQSVTDLTVELTGVEGDVHALHLADLPERSRLAIRAVLRRSLLPRTLSPDELDQLTSGAATMGGLLRVALIRAIERLEIEEDPAVLRLALDLVDLFEQFEARIPFDAQSAFWRIWINSTPSRQAELNVLHHRLGFAEVTPQADGAAE